MMVYGLLLLGTLLAYATSLRYGFSQDDWFFLLISRLDSPWQIWQFFSPWHQSGFAFFRPLGTQLYYYLATSLVGLASAPFLMHSLMLLLQSLNGYLVYRLSLRLKFTQRVALAVAILYAVSASHFLSLFYIAATQQLLATFGVLLALLFFSRGQILLAALGFGLGLLSKETAIVAPGLMALWLYHHSPRRAWIYYLQQLWPSALVLVAYLALRLMSQTGVQSEYHLIFGQSVVSTLRWYLLFGYGAPEILLNYALPGMFINFFRFTADFGLLGLFVGLTPVLIALVVLGGALWRLWRQPRVYLQPLFTYCLWFLGTLVPVLFLNNHRYPHYVDLALIPLLWLVATLFRGAGRVLLMIVLLAVNLASIRLSEQTHWTTQRALQAERAQAAISQSGGCAADTWLIAGEGREPLELSYALSLANGPRVLCNNPELQVYYQGITPLAPSGAWVLATKGIVE